MRTIILTDQEVEALGEALDLAHGDQQSYLNNGNPSVDYGNEWPAVALAKAERFLRLAAVGEKLGFPGERERWEALAESVAESAGE